MEHQWHWNSRSISCPTVRSRWDRRWNISGTGIPVPSPVQQCAADGTGDGTSVALEFPFHLLSNSVQQMGQEMEHQWHWNSRSISCPTVCSRWDRRWNISGTGIPVPSPVQQCAADGTGDGTSVALEFPFHLLSNSVQQMGQEMEHQWHWNSRSISCPTVCSRWDRRWNISGTGIPVPSPVQQCAADGTGDGTSVALEFPFHLLSNSVQQMGQEMEHQWHWNSRSISCPTVCSRWDRRWNISGTGIPVPSPVQQCAADGTGDGTSVALEFPFHLLSNSVQQMGQEMEHQWHWNSRSISCPTVCSRWDRRWNISGTGIPVPSPVQQCAADGTGDGTSVALEFPFHLLSNSVQQMGQEMEHQWHWNSRSISCPTVCSRWDRRWNISGTGIPVPSPVQQCAADGTGDGTSVALEFPFHLLSNSVQQMGQEMEHQWHWNSRSISCPTVCSRWDRRWNISGTGIPVPSPVQQCAADGTGDGTSVALEFPFHLLSNSVQQMGQEMEHQWHWNSRSISCPTVCSRWDRRWNISGTGIPVPSPVQQCAADGTGDGTSVALEFPFHLLSNSVQQMGQEMEHQWHWNSRSISCPTVCSRWDRRWNISGTGIPVPSPVQQCAADGTGDGTSVALEFPFHLLSNSVQQMGQEMEHQWHWNSCSISCPTVCSRWDRRWNISGTGIPVPSPVQQCAADGTGDGTSVALEFPFHLL